MELPSLPDRPRAEVFKVEDILRLAKSGQLRVPAFQTGLRWKGSHVADLFDSILRGFPIGGLLLWQHEAEAETLNFGPVTVDAPKFGDALHIVDGQQRVTALVGSLLHPDECPLGGTHTLWVNLLNSRLEVRRSRPPTDEVWIPVNLFGERRKLQHWARSVKLGDQTEALVDRAFEIEESIIRYELTAYIVRNADAPALRLIFSRTNSSGVPLKEPEVFQALFGASGQPKPIAALATELATETGFGPLPETWLLRCLKAIAQLNPRLNFDESNPPPGELMIEAKNAMRAAIGFLQREVGFIHAAVLPYRFPLIILARFFHLHPKPHPRSRVLLTRWLWRGALAQVHGNSSNANVASHLAALDQDEHATVQRLLARVPKEAPLVSARDAWYGGAAWTRLHAASMFAQEPADITSGRPWSQEELLGQLAGHAIGELFGRAFPGDAAQIAARVYLPPRGDADGLTTAPDEVLHSLGIVGQAASALRGGDQDAFLNARAEYLDQRLAHLVALRASPDEDDRPPILALRTA